MLPTIYNIWRGSAEIPIHFSVLRGSRRRARVDIDIDIWRSDERERTRLMCAMVNLYVCRRVRLVSDNARLQTQLRQEPIAS